MKGAEVGDKVFVVVCKPQNDVKCLAVITVEVRRVSKLAELWRRAPFS